MPDPETLPAPALADLAATINFHHAAAEGAARTALDLARNAGAALLEAKAQVPYGQWGRWLAGNCPRVKDRTARAYMQLARGWELLESKTAVTADLTLDHALKLLAAPVEPEADPLETWLASLNSTAYPVGCVGWVRNIPPAVWFLDALGRPATDIARRLGLSVATVGTILDPQPLPRGNTNPQDLPQAAAHLAPLVNLAETEYRFYLGHDRNTQLVFWCGQAADLARRFARPDLAERFQGMALVYQRETERLETHYPEWPETDAWNETPDCLLSVGAFIAAGCDWTRAITGDRLEYPTQTIAQFVVTLWRKHFEQQNLQGVTP